MERILVVGLIFICFGRNFAQVKTIGEHFLIGEDLELRPPSGISKNITGVQWRHNDNIVAEWAEGDAEVDTYGDFKGRADLDTATGILLIRKTTKAEAGDYTIEINNNRLDVKYVVKSVKAVPEPNVWVKPNEVENQRECVCEGNVEGAEPVTYFWNTGPDRSWVESGKNIVINDTETTRLIETYSCKIKNPVSEKESKPEKNPFYHKAADKNALWALVLIPILIIVLGGGLGYWKRAAIKEKCNCAGGEGATRNGTVNKVEDAETNLPLNSAGNAPPPSPKAVIVSRGGQ